MFDYQKEHSAEFVPDGAKWQFEELVCEKHSSVPLVLDLKIGNWLCCSVCEKNGGGCLTSLNPNSLRVWTHNTALSQEGIEFIDPDSGKHWRVPAVRQEIIGDLELESGCKFHVLNLRDDCKYLSKEGMFKDIPETAVLMNQKRNYICLPRDHVVCEICEYHPIIKSTKAEKYTDCLDVIGRLQCFDCKHRRTNSLQFIYVIYGESNQLLKIGLTDNPINRFPALATQGGQNLRLFHLFESTRRKDVVKLEKEAHKIAAKTRVIGEWFHPSNETFDAISMLQERKDLREVTFKTRVKSSIIKTRLRSKSYPSLSVDSVG